MTTTRSSSRFKPGLDPGTHHPAMKWPSFRSIDGSSGAKTRFVLLPGDDELEHERIFACDETPRFISLP
jgi:hypothetical protein